MKFQYCGTQYYRAKEAILLFGGQRVLVPVKLLMGFVFFNMLPFRYTICFISAMHCIHRKQTVFVVNSVRKIWNKYQRWKCCVF